MDPAMLPENSTGRSMPDLTALLLELSRVVKARGFYRPGDERMAQLFARALRAWQGDLERHGPVALELDAGALRVTHAPDGRLGEGRLAELVGELELRGIDGLRVEPGIDAEAFAGLIDVLTRDPDELAQRGGAARVLARNVPMGIELRESASAATPPLEFVTDPTQEETEPLGAGSTPPGHEDTEPLAEPEAGPELEIDFPIARDPLPRRAAEADSTRTPSPPRTRKARARRPATASATPSPVDLSAVELAPLERGVRDDQSAELVDLLRELDACEEASQYADLARRAVNFAERADEAGRADDAYRVMLVLSEHAASGKRSQRHCEMAADFLDALATGDRLTRLIERACAPDHERGVRATQILLQLGSEAVRPLLEAAEHCRDDTRRGQMHGILIALGEKALPELIRVLEGEHPELIHSAIRLVGDIQNPDAVRPLETLLHVMDETTRDEAAKALARIGDSRAIDALMRQLGSRRKGMPELAVYCLAATGSPRAVPALVGLLGQALGEGHTELAREIVRGLGRLGRPEATAQLASILLKKSWFGGRKRRDLKVAAAAALGALPGDEAVGALAQAANSRDTQIRRAAQTALDRRARALQHRRA